MSIKDDITAGGHGRRRRGAEADPTATGSDDIAKLLRALNEELNDAPAERVLPADGADEDPLEPRRERGLPLGAIAVALLAAAGIGFAVTMMEDGSPDSAPAAGTPPQAVSAPGAAPTDRPEALIARAPEPQPPPPLAAPEAAAMPPAPPPPAPLPQSAPSQSAPPQVTIPQVTQAPQQRIVIEPPPPSPEAPPPSDGAPVPDPAALQAMLRAPAGPTTAPAPDPAVKAPRAEAPTAIARPVDKGRYAVQVGSFTVPTNADTLATRLKDRGYPAYTLDWTDRSKQAWRVVRVGNFGSDAEARRSAEDLRARMALPTRIVTTR